MQEDSTASRPISYSRCRMALSKAAVRQRLRQNLHPNWSGPALIGIRLPESKPCMQSSSTAMMDQSVQLCECFDRLASEKQRAIPLSTYRLQFNKHFRFDDARQLIPYLWKLGVSHCYSSPILKARAGSQHGYDIIDHNKLNPEIGTE